MNLLPEEEKNNLRREYKARFNILVVYFAVAVCLLGAVAIFPYYVSGRTELIKMKFELDALGGEEANQEIRKAFVEFREFSKKLELLDSGQGSTVLSPSDVLELILRGLPSGVRVTSLSYVANEGDRPGQIVVSGVAGNRDGLLSFTKNLSEVEFFSAVDLPVSNFSQKNEIDFSLTITLVVSEDEGEGDRDKNKENAGS